MEYTFFKQFVLRTPLYPIEKLQAVLSESNFEKSITALFNFFQEPINQEALFLASPDLHNRLLDYYKGEIKEPSKIHGLAFSLMKYFQRMTTRCTPFGLFASIGVGSFSDSNNVCLNTTIANYRHTRLDMNYLCALASALAQILEIQAVLKFYVNSSVYVIGEEMRYIEYHYENSRRIHKISSVDFSEYIQKIFQVAKTGATKLALASSIVNEEITLEDAVVFVEEMIGSQLLISELEPSLCGDEFLNQLIKTLRTLPLEEEFYIKERKWTIEELVLFLEELNGELEKIDSNNHNEISKYLSFAESLEQLGVGTELGKLFQTDLSRTFHHNSLDEKILRDIKNAVKFLNKISIKHEDTKLEKFAKAFYERYEDEEIPLLYALDIETGIGYTQPAENQQNFKINWSRIDEVLLEKLLQARADNVYEIVVSDEDFSDFNENWDEHQDTMSFMIELIMDEVGEPKIVMSGGGGSSGGNILGRFCHANEEIHNIVNTIIAKEEELKPADSILAEIIHLPESRTGNILMRPTLRTYEIPYLAKSSVKDEYQITADDLMVSVRGQQVILRSKRLNKVIIPRLTNAHNFSFNSLPMYNFLCDLQTQHSKGGLGFSWGVLESNYGFLPRVNYKNTILSPAKWILKKALFANLIKIDNNDSLMEQVANWRKKHKMPQFVKLIDFDNELLVDLQNVLSVKTFINTIKKRDSIQLSEFLFNLNNCFVTDESGHHYVNQFVLINHRDKISNSRNQRFETSFSKTENIAKRKFILGDDWLYYKFYCGTKTADFVLQYGINEVIEELKGKNLIKKWFFIRYADPKHHLRLRFQLTDPAYLSEVSSILKENISYFLENKLIWKLQTDTYNRELERYGNQSIDISETLFQISSEQILSLLPLLTGEDETRDREIRWFFGLKAIDELLNSFGLNLQEKKTLSEDLAEGFGREFNMNIDLKKQLGERFRKERATIFNVLQNGQALDDDFKSAFEIFRQYREATNEVAKEILMLNQSNLLELPLEPLLNSYIHMLMNRLFTDNQRHTEMIQYHLLWHFYRSELAKSKNLGI